MCIVVVGIDDEVRAIDFQIASHPLEVTLKEEACDGITARDIDGGVDEQATDRNGTDVEVYENIRIGARLIVGELQGGALNLTGCGRGCNDSGSEEGGDDGSEVLHGDD